MPQYSAVLKTGGFILFSGFYSEDLKLIKQRAIDCSLEYIQHRNKENWVAAQFEKENKMKKIIIILCLSLLADSLMGQSKKRLSVFTEDSGTFRRVE